MTTQGGLVANRGRRFKWAIELSGPGGGSRQHHFHLPYYDGVYDGLATHSSTYGHFSHFQDAGEFKSEVSSRLGLSHWEPDGFGIGSLQVPVHGTVAYTCIRLASLY
ncbi:ER membrane protein complex subunit 4 isoform e [Mus musculus]|uniref:ER membrane protein complex subunit 4 isoform e n=1 Tax=Mus musculus TaxID=10090 RepID=UPI0023E38767|nr:ER membrane protein complex subunit 4 isoform e [Mus musculus]